jgi:hypothetical protein
MGLIGKGADEGASMDMIYGLVILFPCLLFTMLCTAYVTTISMAIVADVAIGCHTVESWADPDIREWIMMLRFPLLTTLLAGMCGYPFHALGLTILGALISFMAFPLILACQLESGSALFPFSLPVLKGMASYPTVWLTFYGLAAILIAGGILLLWGAQKSAVMLLLAGPGLGGILLILSCLLGRVLYLTSGSEHPDAVKDDDEDDA